MSAANEEQKIRGPVLALDLGEKRIGVALSDNLLISIRRLEPLTRSNWKQLLRDVAELVQRFDAQTLVIGLPLRLAGDPGSAAGKAKQTAQKFSRSLALPVYLQDERLTSVEAEERLRAEGFSPREVLDLVDSESAAIILRDFVAEGQRGAPARRA